MNEDLFYFAPTPLYFLFFRNQNLQTYYHVKTSGGGILFCGVIVFRWLGNSFLVRDGGGNVEKYQKHFNQILKDHFYKSVV